MKKLSLLLSILISFIFIVPLSHASSGDITIGTKTYTQSEAQKQIVQPLLKRIEKQKIAKIKIRLINLTIRQYTNKQKIAQKQGNIDLVNFYSGVVFTLNGKINETILGGGEKQAVDTTGIKAYILNGKTFKMTSDEKIEKETRITKIMNSGDVEGKAYSTSSKFLYDLAYTHNVLYGSYELEYAIKISEDLIIGTGGSVYWSNGVAVVPSRDYLITEGGGAAGFYNGTSTMTRKQVVQRLTENEVFTTYDGSGGANQSKKKFITWIVEQYGPNTYAVEYANTLKFNDTVSGTTSSSNGSVVNNGGTTVTGGQSNDGMFLAKGTQDEVAKAQVRDDVYDSYSGGLGANQSKTRFINFISQQYGVNTYAVQYASTFTFNTP